MALFHTTVLDNQIKALPTVDTASGSIATFDTDMTENLVEVLCNITPVQTGSGTPSPSNPRPITTYSELNLIQTYKNVLAKPFVYYSLTSSTDTFFIKSGTYKLSFGGISGATNWRVGIHMKDRQGNNLSDMEHRPNTTMSWYSANNWWLQGSNVSTTEYTITIVEDCYIRIVFALGDTDTSSVASNVQLELGSTATPYTPFGSYHTIPFGQTVANGVLNVGTGKLRVTMSQPVALNTLTWVKTQVGQYDCFYGALNNGSKESFPNVDGLCTDYANSEDSGMSVDNTIRFYGSTQYNFSRCLIRDDSKASLTAEQFKTAATGSIIYELETPYDIQLDSVQIQALLNENNIWCDTGDTSVKYLLTVGKAIS